ncbi:MAG: diguanylate cyclase [Ignavibacteriales bacterium]
MQLELADRILFLIITCFSFLMFVMALTLNKNDVLFKTLGQAFAIPLVLCFLCFLTPAGLFSWATVFFLAEFCLLIALLLLSITADWEHHLAVTALCGALPLVLLGLDRLFPVAAQNILAYRVPLLAVAAALNIFWMLFRKNTRSMLFRAMLLFFASAVGAILVPLALIFKSLAYTALALYFYRESNINLINRYSETKKKLTNLEKSISLEVKKRTFEIERANQNLLMISKTDSLTKAFTRVAILNIIERLTESKTKNPFAVLLFDVDHFKNINDTYGHVTGDMILKQVANIAKNSIRDIDNLGRYGGDEFIIVLPNAAIDEAMYVAERFRKKIDDADLKGATVSIGVAGYPDDAMSAKGLLSIADEGLYISKEKGRNAVSHRKK